MTLNELCYQQSSCAVSFSEELLTQTAHRGRSLEVRCSASKHCSPSKRIAVHSAFYGYSPCFNVTECASQSASDAGESALQWHDLIGVSFHRLLVNNLLGY